MDAMVNPNRISPLGYGEKVVDYAGGLALLSEMGGVLTSFTGEPVALDYDLLRRTPLLAATTPELHTELLETLHQVEWDEANP
jgi:fructose-1,6-bisphosphatase/inositol monophosphatase family enzyme